MAINNKIFIEKYTSSGGADVANIYLGLSNTDSESINLDENKLVSAVPSQFYITKKNIIGDKPMVDYIVDYSSKSINGVRWQIRKWHSGRMEQWASWSDSGNQSGFGRAYNNLYITYTMKNKVNQFPEPWVEEPIAYLISGADSGTNMYHAGWCGWSITSPGTYIRCLRPRTSERGRGTWTFCTYYMGRWK